MNEQEIQDQEIEPDVPTEELIEGKKARNAFGKIRRDLSEDEITSPGALKLLLDKMDTLEITVSELSDYRDKFYNSDKRVAVLETVLKNNIAGECLYGFSLTVGSVFVGLSPSVWDKQPYGALSVLLGVSLIIGAVIFKAKNK